MSAQDFWEDDLLELILTNVAAPNVGDASGLQPSAGAGSFFTSLMTALPAESVSDQTTNEATYTGRLDRRLRRRRQRLGRHVPASDRGIRHDHSFRPRLCCEWRRLP
jgi:hypothetical protein